MTDQPPTIRGDGSDDDQPAIEAMREAKPVRRVDPLIETEAIVDKLSDEVSDLCEFIRDTVTGPIPDRVREIMFERLA